MSVETSRAGQIVENADIDRDTPQPAIHVEERKLSLHDFLKTCVKVGGSDLHLQESSTPMIRVDGRARFLDCPPPTAEAMKEYVNQIINTQGEPEDRRHTLDHKGAVDVAYILPGVARFRTNIFHSREKFAIVMRRIVAKIPNFDDLNLPPQVEAVAEHHRGIVIVSGTDRIGKIDDAGGDHRQNQPHPLRTDHHGGRPHRIPARKRQEPGQPGGSRHRQRKL